MEEFVIILLDLSGFYGHVHFIGLHFSILFILYPVDYIEIIAITVQFNCTLLNSI